MQVQKPPQKHAHTALVATAARLELHIVPHMWLHNLSYSAILMASAIQARMQLHNLPHRHACRCITYRARRHTLHYLPHRHACSGIIGHTGTALFAKHTLTQAVAQFAKRACTQLLAITFAATQAVRATQADMHVQNLQNKRACTALAATRAHMKQYIVQHMRLHQLPYSDALGAFATQAGIQLHNLPHMHACRCIICHAGMHALHYLPNRHACSRIICHARAHAGAESAMPSATQA